MRTVTVMMSVYNGQRFLQEQIDSILAQDGVDVRLIIRDDGSMDATRRIIEGYGDLVEARCGDNLGVCESFLQVAFDAPLDSDFYAFSDADDVWETDKLLRGVTAIEQCNGPALYASRMKLVDERLNFIGWSPDISGKLGFGHALVQGGLGGATAVMNRSLFELFRSHRPRRATLHDHWLYLLSSGLGEVRFDRDSRILYRQHGSNTIGGRPSGAKLWARRLTEVLQKDKAKRQAEEFHEIFGHALSTEKRAVIQKYIWHGSTLYRRLSFAISNPLIFNNKKSKLFYAVRVLGGRT
ncbi:glycosyltransferase family 2 protein [Devosia albogilva]|uniref:Glycosyltransferase family 2 protein n=1 Tax=Devosia albogilva TaxID=429726 RepID=A0ABW5QM68_9HYPH